MPDNGSAMPLAWSLGAYFLLQVMLNLRLRGIPRNAADSRSRLLSAAALNGLLNALFFIAVSAYLIITGKVPAPALPQPLWLWLLGSIPAGLLLWGLRLRMRGLGQRIFGGSAFLDPAEQLLREPGSLSTLNRSALQLGLLEPLGHELFFRACCLALMQSVYGSWPAILATAIVELLLRLNPAWALSVLVSSAALSGLALAGGGPLATVCTAIVAGFLQSYMTAYQALRSEPPSA
ncbi:hypothetical protein KDL44_03810 [bacterium]|nr:hypothetical protein [bacterium]